MKTLLSCLPKWKVECKHWFLEGILSLEVPSYTRLSPLPHSVLRPSCWGQYQPSSGQHGHNVCQHPEVRQAKSDKDINVTVCTCAKFTLQIVSCHIKQGDSEAGITLMAVMAKAIFLLPSIFVLRTRRMCWNFSGMTKDWGEKKQNRFGFAQTLFYYRWFSQFINMLLSTISRNGQLACLQFHTKHTKQTTASWDGQNTSHYLVKNTFTSKPGEFLRSSKSMVSTCQLFYFFLVVLPWSLLCIL